jgi:catechol 2,3-dioxygenase-like lactoylglutathione lyase family enzyme
MTTPIAQPTAGDASPFASWKVDHAAIRVPDFEAAIAWYTEKLDFRLKKHVSFAGLTFAFLSPAGNNSFIFELLAGPGADSRPRYAELQDGGLASRVFSRAKCRRCDRTA